ncbi:hypothetical protein SPBR_07205 [Sporothrix brasiliensis 5110]|uniref:Uncharacterized protein n=1 Tax=Sporothrix brasiliensis 5110 TaxID=1398154 RepID=A0A0C2IMF6_9PEZI|nr:uncharacterized protein SPBR_07205 [Sporothrix brasiliensis 5110]KIH88205.1 hypothetical protein SPBR_07205 [Sporothrix brasiliensis 5110]
MAAQIIALQDQGRHFEFELREKEALVARLEESLKEKTKSLISSSEKFASELQQLTSTFHNREEEYRRAVDQASELAIKEARRTSGEDKQETKRELQQERARRQALEKELRQAKEDLSVEEEKSKRIEQSNEALQNELGASKLGNQAVTVHLEEKTRALETRLDHDATLITQLKAALSDKEMDYVNLRSSMEAYDEKVRVLIEHLRVWAQDHSHISAIRSRLEMLSQIDQSCAATARIREAEQIDNVLAQLRQYYACQNEQDAKLGFGSGRSTAAPAAPAVLTPLHHDIDDEHEQCVSDLSAFLDAEVAGEKTAGHARSSAETWTNAIQAAILGGSRDSLKTPGYGQGPQDQGSDMKPPPVHKERIVHVAVDPKSGMGTLSSPMVASPIPTRTRRETRSSAANKAARRNPVSSTGKRATRSAKRKRLDTVTGHGVVAASVREHSETSVYFQGGGQSEVLPSMIQDEIEPVAAMMASSRPALIKIEDS